jgi:hypothetical protein
MPIANCGLDATILLIVDCLLLFGKTKKTNNKQQMKRAKNESEIRARTRERD